MTPSPSPDQPCWCFSPSFFGENTGWIIYCFSPYLVLVWFIYLFIFFLSRYTSAIFFTDASSRRKQDVWLLRLTIFNLVARASVTLPQILKHFLSLKTFSCKLWLWIVCKLLLEPWLTPNWNKSRHLFSTLIPCWPLGMVWMEHELVTMSHKCPGS